MDAGPLTPSPNRYRRHRDVEAGGSFGERGTSADDKFDIPHKNAPIERLKRWRQAALVLNASRRFRYTLDLKKEEQKEQIRRKIRSHAQVIRAAIRFKDGAANVAPGTPGTPVLPSGGFGIGVDQLTALTRDHDVATLQEYGGVKGISTMLKTDMLKPKKKKKKADSSLLVLGTGSGDVLALDVSLGQLKWKVCDCHPGGVTAISFSRHTSCIIYTAGVDGMVCQIDSSTGSVVGKFKSSRKAISALCISADGKLIATAASQLKIFDCSNNKKIKKFSGHPVSVRCAIFSEDGKYILSSAVGERYIAIWKMDGGKKQSASCVLALEHPAIILDMKGSDSESSEVAGLYVLAISEAGLCYFWYGSNIEALQNSKPTKIALASGSFSRNNKGLAIFAAKFDSVAQPASTPVLVAYGTLIKPLFEKLMVQYGEDMNLEASQDGVLVSTRQSYIPHKGHKTLNKVTALDRANAEDAILPLPKLYVSEKKRKHGKPPVIGDVEKGADAFLSKMDKSWPARAEGYPHKIEEKDVTCVEDKLRAAGILGGKDNLVIGSDHRSESMQNDSHFPVDANASTKKIRSHIMSLSSDDAYKLLDILVSSWKSRSATSKHALSWIYFILVIHGQFIMSQESSKKLIGSLQKMTRLRCEAIQPLLNLSGRLQLIMAQIDKAGKNIVQVPLGEHINDHSEDEEDEDESIDELVYGEEDASQSDSSDDD